VFGKPEIHAAVRCLGLRSVLPTAHEVVDRAERIVLSECDTARVLDLLENPPKPFPSLMAAARRRAARM
jgi:uncharacterized protein (DUF1778 family)